MKRHIHEVVIKADTYFCLNCKKGLNRFWRLNIVYGIKNMWVIVIAAILGGLMAWDTGFPLISGLIWIIMGLSGWLILSGEHYYIVIRESR